MNKPTKHLLIFFLPVWLFLFSIAQGNINGSFGGLYEKSLKSFGLYGIFIEVNNQKFGGYISVVGDTKETRVESYRDDFTINHGSKAFVPQLFSLPVDGKDFKSVSTTNFSLGVTYFVKKRFGLLAHIGMQRSLAAKRYYRCSRTYLLTKITPGHDLERYIGATLKDWGAKCYFTYGIGILCSAPVDWVTWHAKVTIIDNNKKATYFGVGLGFHIF